MNVKKRITDMVLIALEKSIDGYLQIEDFALNPEDYIQSNYPKAIKKSSLAQALKRLRERGIIELISDEKIIAKLTDKGKEAALIASLKATDREWDGRWRIVFFDIPEQRRAVRDRLRYKLKEWGFVPKQKSVWISKKNCTKALRQFVKDLGVEEWVLVIESDNTNF
jgi:phenylacetic acid degradation operon negative regulatory protein